MKRKFVKERQWEISNTEKKFEELLKENGYTILGYREYMSKTEYLIKKDLTEVEYSIYSIDNKSSRGIACFRLFEEYFNLTKEYEKRMLQEKANQVAKEISSGNYKF